MAAHSDSDEDETLVTLGTPLEVPNADEPIKKPVRLQDIQATDSKGRPRFHGAFTGGFSAGYFNTVGTKEGWTPSTFVSSREKRQDEKPEQRPEHYMDEEDMGEYGIAPRKYVTGAQFSSEERKKRRFDEIHNAKTDAVLPGEYALLELIIPERITIGVKLLRKMGWKEGQGVGPRLSGKQKHKAGKKIYGCEMPPSPDSCDGLDDESFLSDVTYAPLDSAVSQLSTKDNTHGLGYKGLDPRKALLSSHVNLFEPTKITRGGSSRKGISGQGFGVGAMEDDDEDIYTVDSMSNYDMTMGGEDDGKFGWTGPSGKRQVDTPVGYVGKMLDGFTLSNKKLVQKKDFPPPKLPRDFRPVHTFIREEDSCSILTTKSTEGVDYRQFLKPSHDTQTTVTSSETPGSSREERKQYKDASSRSVALGEKPFVGSVFDLISQGDKDKMKNVQQGTSQLHGQATSTDLVSISDKAERKPPASTAQSSTEEHRQTNAHLLQRAVGFKPFSKDPGKQQRYDKYLELVKLGHKDPYSAMTSTQTEWEREREKEEFHTAARLYRPLAAMMAMRFTRAGNVDEQTNVKVDETVDTSDAGKAADMKLYGKLTRDVLEWHPDKVMCKRFNVPNPYPGSTIIGLATVKRDKYSVFNFLNFAAPTSTEHDQMPDTLPQEQSTSTSEQSMQPESRADKELNKGKLTKSIFSHLVATEKETQRSTKPVSFSVKPTKSNKPKEFKSIFSHLENEKDTVKSVKDVPIAMDTHEKERISKVEDSDRKDEEKIFGTKSSEKDDGQTGVDLFRAIFRNTDSEDSSEDDAIITKDDNTRPTTNMVVDADTTGGDRLDTSLVPEVQDDEDNQTGNTPALLGNLPGNGEPMETLGDRLSCRSESDDSDSYGPVLPPDLDVGRTASSSRPVPPADIIDLTRQSAADYKGLSDHSSSRPVPPADVIDLTRQRASDYKGLSDHSSSRPVPPADVIDLTRQSAADYTEHSSRKHKSKHKHKKEKKVKHKQNKHRKKNKKKEKKVRRRHGDSSDETDTTDKDTDDDTATDKEILNKLKSMKAERIMRAVDFL